MRVLILSVTAGGGHNSTAMAMDSYFKSKGVDSKVLDTFDSISKPLSKTISEGYLLVTSKAKFAFDEGYRMAERRRTKPGSPSPMRVSGALMSKKLKEYISIYEPDVIIYTHIFAGIILDVISQKHGLKAKTIGVLTDFVFHPYWEEATHSDYVITASEMLNYQGFKKGFKRSQLKSLGIPINPKFAVSGDKKEAKKALGLDPEKPTVLVMGGSMGYGDISQTVSMLDNIDLDYSMIVVCGNNKKQYDAVSAMKTKKQCKAFGFTDKVSELMDASECIITKPGGLTTSEALAKRLPMIIVNPIPGQEERNSEFLLNNGAAFRVTEDYSLDEAVYNLMCSPKRYDLMLSAIDMLRHPDSTADICEFAIEIASKK
ncbi:MAG: galactosyldiacylglycerol synthase [Ruminococcaceae bacterium]|nr:galactosyldiacylglycerol synthase [Oscillospiraceae bacterium]